jgi:hypothetical protein
MQKSAWSGRSRRQFSLTMPCSWLPTATAPASLPLPAAAEGWRQELQSTVSRRRAFASRRNSPLT